MASPKKKNRNAYKEIKFNKKELKEFRKIFDSFDKNGDGNVDAGEMHDVLKNLGLYQSLDQISQLIEEVDQNDNGTIEWNEFLDIIRKVKIGDLGTDAGFAHIYQKQKDLIQVKGFAGVHSFSPEEMCAFAEHFNNCLGTDPDCKHLMPIGDGVDLCKKVGDGILLCKFINLAVPDTIDERCINTRKGNKKLGLFKINENQNLCIASAKAIGVQTVNLGATELIQGRKFPHMVLGMVWQLVKIQLLNSINLKNHPELVRLLFDGEELEDLLRLPPEQLLLRWFNYHLKNAKHPRRVRNFRGDVKDSECYTVLLNQIAPNVCDRSALETKDRFKRAKKVLLNSAALDVKTFIKPADIVKGNPKLNLAFTAAIFNQCPGLDPISEEKMKTIGLMDDDFGDSREERAFRMWINSLGIPNLYINNLYEDCKSGIALLKVIDRIVPGIVAWKKVEKKPKNTFRKVSNNNYVILLGRRLKLKIVNMQGADFVQGNKKLLLGYVWQLMRLHTLKFLAEVQKKKFGGKKVTDQMIIDWANKLVKSKGRKHRMRHFKDRTLRTSLFFMDLLYCLEKRVINWEFVTRGKNKKDRMLNAKYCISVARKLGAVIFLLPEDILDVKPKMMLTFVASIMSIAK